MKKTILFIFAWIFIAMLIARASADVCYCNSCSSCTGALNNASCTEVKLTANLTTSSIKCIDSNKNNKIFDCQGHEIRGTGEDAYDAIWLDGNNNFTVKNCVITNFSYGIHTRYNENITLMNNYINAIKFIAIFPFKARNLIIMNNSINCGSYYGIWLYIINNTLILNNHITNCSYSGIKLYYGMNNSINNNYITMSNNGIYIESYYFVGYISNNISNNIIEMNNRGIDVITSSNDYIYNNFFNNTNNFLFYEAGENKWNITKTSGINIVNGPYLGGNFWAKPDGTGFSENCTDSNNDGICDEAYTLNSNNIDYLPLTYSLICYCDSCASCTAVLNRTIKCDEVILAVDIINHSGTCIDHPVNFRNKVFDCQGHIIDGVGSNYGIDMGNSNIKNNTIKNCVIREFNFGIYLNSSLNNIITNNNFSNNQQIYLDALNFFYENLITGNNLELITNNTTLYSNVFLITNYLKFSTNNSLLYNNLFKAKNIVDNSYESAFNTTLQNGSRIAGLKNYFTQIGGNYWTNWDDNGYSDVCEDSDLNGFCDALYNKNNIVDYLPITGRLYVINASYSYETLEGSRENYSIEFISKNFKEIYFNLTNRIKITNKTIETYQEDYLNYSKIKAYHSQTIPTTKYRTLNHSWEIQLNNQTTFKNYTQIVYQIWLSTTPTGNLTNLIYQLNLKDRNTKNDVRANISGIIKLYSIDGVFIRDFTLNMTDTTLKLYAPNITNASNNMTFYLKTEVSSIENSSYYTERDYICLKADPDNPTNRTLYIYPATTPLSKIFFNIKDKNQRSYANAYVTLEELTPQGYFLVGSRKTDIYGSINKYLIEDIEHRINITDQEKCELSHSKKMLIQCKEIPCVFDIIASITDKFLETIKDYNFNYSFNYDKETKKAIFYYDGSEVVGGFDSLTFYVVKRNILNETLIYQNTSYSDVDYFEVEINESGDYEAFFEVRTQNGKIIKEKITFSDTLDRFGSEGLIWSLLFVIVLFMVGLWNPVVAISLAVVGVILTAVFGFVNLPYIAIVALVTIALIMIIKMRT